MTAATILAFASAIMAASVSLVVALRANRSVVRWSFAVGLAVLAFEGFCTGRASAAGILDPESLIFWQENQFLAMSLLPGVWLLFSLSYARGNARAFLRRWRSSLAIAFVVPPGLALFARKDLFETLFDRPEADNWMAHLGWSGMAVSLLVMVGAILILVNLERTFRASAGTMRWRIKFMLMGVGALFVARLYTTSEALLFHGIDPAHETINSCVLILAPLLMLRSLLRAGHFELDVYPSQSVLQGSVIFLLTGVYLLIVGILAKIVVHFGGGAAFALLTLLVLVALVLFAIILQSDRVRLHLRRFISRHFQRPLYDYRTLWRIFTEGTAQRMDQIEVSRSLVKLIADTFQALSISIWLMDEKRETLVLAASTSLSDATAVAARDYRAGTADILLHFRAHPEAVDIEQEKGKWAEVLRQWHPTEFPHGGDRVCVPLVGRGDVLGLIVLGDRVGGAVFSAQDFDILKCIGDHAAASLLNVQLSQRLVQAKELEAFQTMAAFFVHDLKNAASTLNLMLQNLPVHFNDPAFRDDALRGISKTVTHINQMVGRLGQLRHDLSLQLAPVDLNTVVDQALASLGGRADPAFESNLNPLPAVLLDREQMHKVVTNLLLNAKEALVAQSTIRVSTEEADGWVILSVADQGCGMTPEFVRHSLFRPFQTTKKSGLGIGMFQSRMIVEAHQGRIAVASEPGKGTTFRVFLPVKNAAG